MAVALHRLTRALATPVDAASSGAFRILFGLVMAASMVRFWAKGWIDALYIEPTYHFTYWGFGWVQPLPAMGMYAVFAMLIVLALLVAAGVSYRFAMTGFFVLFTWVELLEQSTYLNHYYFVSIVSGLMIFMPLHRALCLVPRRERAPETIGAWVPWTLRLQLGLVYVFAGVAKLQPDWLLHAQPLRLWLQARSHLPIVGPLLAVDAVAFAMSWGGALFDLLVVPLLSWRRTRGAAYVAVVGFHAVTGLLFDIGMFPLIMIAATTIFFRPSWPRRWLRSTPPMPVSSPPARVGKAILVPLFVHFLVQTTLPTRHLLYPGDTRWHEQASRWSWRVMLAEKTGMVEFRITVPSTGQTWIVDPRDELTALQTKAMATQPDMILQYAHHLAERFRAAGVSDAEVRAHAWAALNGRPSQLLIDPAVDLVRERDSARPKPWIVALRPGPAL